MNMFMHNVPFDRFDIAHGDTLVHPDPKQAAEGPFDAIVSNPPYSIKWVGKDSPELSSDPRFTAAGVLAPKSKADLAFTMHILSNLAANGTAAIVSFPGVMYRGQAEEKIRKYLVDNDFVDAIIQLPGELFFGTSIATCIMVLKRNKKSTGNILFIDASNKFARDGKQNILTEEHIDDILTLYTQRSNIEHQSAVVPNEEIASRHYRLSVASYVVPEDTRPQIDIAEVNQELEQIVLNQEKLRAHIDALISEFTK